MQKTSQALFFILLILSLTACKEASKNNKKNTSPSDTATAVPDVPKIDTAKIIQGFEKTPFFDYTDNNSVFLASFFDALDVADKSHHILYYGDSQVEGDRITTHLRDSVQKTWSGKGVGFIDFDDIASNVNLRRSRSGNWTRNTFFKKKRKDGKYGIAGTTSSYSGATATVTFNLYNHFMFDGIYLIYQHPHKEDCSLKVINNKSGKVLKTIVLKKNDLPEKVDLFKGLNHRSIKLQFDGPSPLLTGIFVDGNTGLQVDNFGMRGHAGYGLLNIKDKWLEKQASLLNTDLVILHYGANEAVYIDNPTELQSFKEGHQNLINKIKKNIPNASILIVSVSEMGNRRTGKPHAYMSQVRDVQKALAKENGCAFWDVLATMREGGQDWHKEGFRAFDGHFTHKGQKKIGFTLAHLLHIADKNHDNFKKELKIKN